MKLLLKTSVFLVVSLSSIAAPKFSKTAMERPFTMPQNSFESNLGFSTKNISSLGVDYGITDNIQLGVGWSGFDLDKNPEQSIRLNAAAPVFSTSFVSSMARVSMPIYFTSLPAQEISASMPLYFSIISGKLSLALLEDFFTINWADSTHASFAFNTKLSYQATHSLYMALGTSLGTLSTAGDHQHLANSFPIRFSVLYAVTPMVDLLGGIEYSNLVNHTGTAGLGLSFGMLFRGGAIEG